MGKKLTYREKVDRGLIRNVLELRKVEEENGSSSEKEVMAIYTKNFDPETGEEVDEIVQIVMYDDVAKKVAVLEQQLSVLREVKRDFESLKGIRKQIN